MGSEGLRGVFREKNKDFRLFSDHFRPSGAYFGSTSGLGHVGSMLLSDWLGASVADVTTGSNRC